MLDPIFTIAYGALFVVVVCLELFGIYLNKKKPSEKHAITDNWRFGETWLSTHAPAAGWFYRVFTFGFLAWVLLHFAVGIG